jgi:four helix bundle protein
MKTRDHRKIIAFQRADDLAVAVYRATQAWPREERFGLTSQIRRAAVSVPANITEGAARLKMREYLHFLSIANGSLREVGYLVHLAGRIEYLDELTSRALMLSYEETCRVLWGLIESVAEGIETAGSVREKRCEYLAGSMDPAPSVETSISCDPRSCDPEPTV